MMRAKVIFMPHANLQYSQLKPERRRWVIENCYKSLFDLVERNGYRIAFEASGWTVEEMPAEKPEVVAQLARLMREGLIEPVTSPYIHFMVSNVPPDLCVDSLKHSLDTWEKYTGVRPETGWNPECSWTSEVPDIYHEAGIRTLVMDADSFFLSFPEIRKAVQLNYDVQGHSNKNKLFQIEEYIKDKPEYLKFLVNPSRARNGLRLIFRSDCMANMLLWYLLGATEETEGGKIQRSDIDELYARWRGRVERYGTFIMPYAEDAEYIGSSAYFYVKQFNEARFFEPEPDSVQRFREIVESALEAGYELALPSEVVRAEGELAENPFIDQIENGVAWHGGTARAWLNTDYALLLDPVCAAIYGGMKKLMQEQGCRWGSLDPELDQAAKALTRAWVSDSRWPPHPTSPGRFNVKESIADLYCANDHMRRSMERTGLDNRKALYSPDIMESQIRCTEQKLMSLNYFGE